MCIDSIKSVRYQAFSVYNTPSYELGLTDNHADWCYVRSYTATQLPDIDVQNATEGYRPQGHRG